LDKYMEQLLTIIRYIKKTSNEIEDFSSEIYIDLLKAQISYLETKFIWIYCHTFKRNELELLIGYQVIPNQVSLFKPEKYQFHKYI
ncbi:MAG: hypothetical protein GXO84_00065, partial [Chlorobi bacterium]|nr:hypothetical protein [Chlorobiota bacterium]